MAVSPTESETEFEAEEFLGSTSTSKDQMHHLVDGCQQDA